MRGDHRNRLERYVLGPLFGLLCVACLMVLIHAGPSPPTTSWTALAPGELTEYETGSPRLIQWTELLDVEASDDFADLLKAVAGMPEGRTMEAVRRLMEERGWTELQYTLRLRLHTDDGGYDDIGYIRRPYQAPLHAPEFLRLLNAARMEPGGVVRIGGPGRDLDGRQAVSILGLDGLGSAGGE